MSNLYKSRVNQQKDECYTRVIDHNEILEQKLSVLFMEQEAKLRKLAGEDPQNPQFQKGLAALQLSVPHAPELEIDYVEQAKEEADQIVKKATADAEEILKRAVQEAQQLKDEARKEGNSQGYSEGMQRAQAEADQMKQRLDKMRAQQEEEYAARLEQMEPELMEVVLEVFTKVLQTDLQVQQDILLHLIKNTVQHIKNSREFRVRVSEEDYAGVSGHKSEILQKIGSEAAFDIIMDDSIEQGQCVIDTDEGIFNCGLDVQYANLIKNLRALSCIDS